MLKWVIGVIVVAAIPVSVWAVSSVSAARNQVLAETPTASQIVLDLSPYETETAEPEGVQAVNTGTVSSPVASSEPVVSASGESGGASASASGDSGVGGNPSAESSTGEGDKSSGTQSSTAQATASASQAAGQVDGTLVVDDGLTPASSDWMEAKLEKYRFDVREEDYADFQAILAKLDQPYIETLIRDKLTEDDEVLLRIHLHERLTDVEYARSKDLFYDYAWILSEEDW